MISKNPSLEITGSMQQTDTKAVISCRILNKDLSNIDMDKYSDEDNPMVAAIKHADIVIISKEIDITMEKSNGQREIMIDKNFTDAISGGHW